MRRILRTGCQDCGHWNRVPVDKVFVEQNTSEPKVKAYIPMYNPIQVSTCEKCGKIIAQPKELVRIMKRA